MGVYLISDNFEELKLNYFDLEREREEKEEEKKEQSQKIITVNDFYLEKIKKEKIIKKKTQAASNLGIQKNEDILLFSTKKEKARTESGVLFDSRLFKSMTVKSKKYDIINYPKDVLELINKIRNNPESFIVDVETAIKSILKYNNQLIYSGNLKVYLNKGEKMFKEAIEYLRKTKSMKSLTFNKDIEIKLPSDEEYKMDDDYFKKQILSQKKIKKIERYYREAIKDPYVGVLMMVVDDTIKNQGQKRITILDPLLNNIYINCKMYGKKFLAYLTFSK